MKHSLALPAVSLAVAALLGTASPAWGQASAPAPSASASSPSSASERASREGDKVFKWILMHSDKPRKTKAEAPKPPAARTEKASATPSIPVQSTAAAAPAETTRPAEASNGSAVAALAPPSARQEKPAEPQPEEDTEEPLVLKTQVDPEFPGALMRNLRRGTVQVKFTVQPDGTVGSTEVVKTTHSRLNTAATAAVKQWRFEPMRHAQLGIVELGFNLD
jgi:TonB family protein